MSDKKYKTLIVWRRRDLRVRDNAALHEACRLAENVIPLFVFDPEILEPVMNLWRRKCLDLPFIRL